MTVKQDYCLIEEFTIKYPLFPNLYNNNFMDSFNNRYFLETEPNVQLTVDDRAYRL